MHVVISTYTFLPQIGGVATNVSSLAQGFHQAGHQVTVITTADVPTDGYEYEVISQPSQGQLFKHYNNADLLILSNLSIKLIYPLIFIRRPFALRHHSERAWKELDGGFFSADTLRRNIIKRATHFMTSDYCGRESGFDYAVTHPFANPKFITPAIVKPPQERSGVLFVGRLEPEKGITWLIDRLPLIQQQLGNDIALNIIGDGSLKETIQQHADTNKHINYLGRQPLEETAKQMGHAAYSIVPSLWAEPFGAVASESLAAGAITLHSDRGGLPETTGGLGYNFDPDSDESFSSALQQAKQLRDATVADAAAWQAYQAKVESHIAQLQPARVVETIISKMKR